MNSKYILRIKTDLENYGALSDLFSLHSPQNPRSFWEYVIDESEDCYNNAINTIVDNIEKNKADLARIGISVDNMTVWYLYEYEEQCNMEFAPNELKRLGENNLTLCISCWENK